MIKCQNIWLNQDLTRFVITYFIIGHKNKNTNCSTLCSNNLPILCLGWSSHSDCRKWFIYNRRNIWRLFRIVWWWRSKCWYLTWLCKRRRILHQNARLQIRYRPTYSSHHNQPWLFNKFLFQIQYLKAGNQILFYSGMANKLTTNLGSFDFIIVIIIMILCG